ncbi:MAG TPA: hypothetical protein VFL71_15250 [Actinomycetes bacterium]|jgi:hypothetical protein|nr:hypothetical protein [Actinomycetes bacterium]
MQSYLSDMLARERIAEFRRDADRHRLAALARAAARKARHAGGSRRAPVARPERVAA